MKNMNTDTKHLAIETRAETVRTAPLHIPALSLNGFFFGENLRRKNYNRKPKAAAAELEFLIDILIATGARDDKIRGRSKTHTRVLDTHAGADDRDTPRAWDGKTKKRATEDRGDGRQTSLEFPERGSDTGGGDR